MKRVLVGLVASAIAVAATAGPAAAVDVETSATVFAGGGTPLSNGVFFPGTAVVDANNQITGLPPVQVTQGTDFQFITLDEAAVGNGHRLISFKRRKGRPLFSSDLLSRPGDSDVVVTSNLQAGTYTFFCSVHSGMLGRIEITAQ